MASARVTRSKRARLAAPPPVAAANDGVLPTEVLFDILLRLPIEELCRLRLVCRAWRTLTSDPGFARAHSSRGRTLLIAGFCKLRGEIKFVDLSGDVVKRMRVDEAHAKYGHNLSAQAEYICISESSERPASVLNVATGAVTVLPAGVAAVEHPTIRRSVYKSTCVLGRVPSTGEYKVLRTNLCATDRDGVFSTACDVITLGRGGRHGRWRARPDAPMCISGCFERRVVVHGVAYFLSNHCDGKTGSSDMVASFDLATEEWRPAMIQGPLSSCADGILAHNKHGSDLQLAELDGCLVAVHCNYQDRSTDLWFLVDVDKGIWSKRYSMQCSSPDHHDDRKLSEYKSFPLIILDDGKIVLWIQREQALRLYDPKTCAWDDLAKVKNYFCIGVLKGNLLCSGFQG